eukprot:scaffold4.g4757.t1
MGVETGGVADPLRFGSDEQAGSVEITADDSGFLCGPAGGGAGAGASSSGAGPSGSGGGGGPAGWQISVGDPVRRVGDSMIPGIQSAHFEYLVTSARGAGGGSRTEVRRRFKDFVALADLLGTTHRGYFVFPRPDKNMLDQQLGKSDFVELRRRAARVCCSSAESAGAVHMHSHVHRARWQRESGWRAACFNSHGSAAAAPGRQLCGQELERYLRKLALHPVVGRSEELRVFLRAEGQLATSFEWQQLQPLRGTLLEGVARLPRQLIGSDSSVPSASEAAQNARNTSDLLRRFKELGERMKQEYRQPPVLADDEVKLREEKAAIEEYAEKLAAASRKAERVVREFEEMGAVLGDLGLSFLKVAKYEDEEGSKLGPYSELGVGARLVATDARRLGMAAVRLSRLSRVATGQAVEALAPLHDELAMAPAAAAALKERETALLTVHSIDEDMERRKRAMNELAAAEHAADAAKREYERVKARNTEELARWRSDKQQAFRGVVHGYAQVNSLFEERSLQVWRGVAEDSGAGEALEQRLRGQR